MGEAMNSWSFFPAEDGWGHMPVWGYADVVESKADGVPEGTRVYGYLPPASHLVVRPDRASDTDFVDVSPHRVDLPAAYNRYLRTDGNDMYEKENEDYEVLLWPLYFTSFLIDMTPIGSGSLLSLPMLIRNAASERLPASST